MEHLLLHESCVNSEPSAHRSSFFNPDRVKKLSRHRLTPTSGIFDLGFSQKILLRSMLLAMFAAVLRKVCSIAETTTYSWKDWVHTKLDLTRVFV